jgi:hypothetical protein
MTPLHRDQPAGRRDRGSAGQKPNRPRPPGQARSHTRQPEQGFEFLTLRPGHDDSLNLRGWHGIILDR